MESPLIDSLSIVAERHGDIAPAVLTRFYEHSPAAATLMDHMDVHMCGRMMDQVLLLLMEDGEQELANYLDFEIANHASYGVAPDMYGALFGATQTIVQELVAEEWTTAMESAWQQRLKTLLDAILAADASIARAS